MEFNISEIPICRICLNKVKIGETFFLVNDYAKTSNFEGLLIKNMIQKIVSEIDFDICNNPIICGQCYDLLVSTYTFKSKCFHTEEKIHDYMKTNGFQVGDKISLTDLIGSETFIVKEEKSDNTENNTDKDIGGSTAKDCKEEIDSNGDGIEMEVEEEKTDGTENDTDDHDADNEEVAIDIEEDGQKPKSKSKAVTSITEAKDSVDNISSCLESSESTTSETPTPLEPRSVTDNVSDTSKQSHLPTSTPVDVNGTEGNSFSALEEDMSIEFDQTLNDTMLPKADNIQNEIGSLATGKKPLTADRFNDFEEKFANIMEKQEKNLGKILSGIQDELRGLREQFSSSNVAILKFNISQDDAEIASMFPIQSEEKLRDVEVKLKNNEFFQKVLACVSLVGGKDINNLISNILRKMLSKELSLGYSGVGRKGKKNFSKLQLYKVILAAVKIHYKDVDDIAVLKRISLVLATSGDLEGGRKARSTKR